MVEGGGGPAVRADAPITTIIPLPPSYRGGTEEYAYRVAVRVGRATPARILTTRVRWGHDPVPLPTEDLPIEYLPGHEVFQRPVVNGRALARVRAAVRESSLVHLHMPFPRVEARVARWCSESGVPLVLTYHMDADFAGASGIPGAGLVTWVYRRWSAVPALRGATAVVSNSRGYAEASAVLSKYLSKVRVIYKGVDVDRLGLDGPATDPAELTRLFPESGPRDRRVLFVGRMVPYKGLRYLLSATETLVREGRGVQLYLAGRGPERPSLERWVAQRGLAGRVHFLGFVPDDRLGRMYRGADVVACPSTSLMESTATCLEEAAAFGVPILGSALPGADESLPNDGVHGLLVAPKDARAVAGGLRTLLDHPPPRGTARFRSWNETADEYLALFRELREERGPSRRTGP